MRAFWMAAVLAMVSFCGAEAAPARKEIRCCIKVPADDGVGTRPYCFNIAAKPARRGKRICRAIGGELQQPAPQTAASR